MKTFACFTRTGAITQIMRSTEGAVKDLCEHNKDLAYVECDPTVTTDTHWINQNKLQAKVELPYKIDKSRIRADGKDTARIIGIPKGAEIIWPDFVTSEMVDDVLEFSVDLPGTYAIEVMAVPYLLTEIEIEAVPAT